MTPHLFPGRTAVSAAYQEGQPTAARVLTPRAVRKWPGACWRMCSMPGGLAVLNNITHTTRATPACINVGRCSAQYREGWDSGCVLS